MTPFDFALRAKQVAAYVVLWSLGILALGIGAAWMVWG